MYIDNSNKFSDSQAITADTVGTNVIDLSQDRSIGNGEPMAVVFSVIVAADVADGDEDYTFEVEYASNAGQSTGRQLMGRRVFESGTPTAPAQDADLLVAGFLFSIPIPPTTLAESEQFIGIRVDVAGTTPSITIDAWLAPLSTVDQSVVYPDNIEIS